MAWITTSGGGIAGETIRDLMLDCVKRWFDALREPHQVQWLADNGSPYAPTETVGFAMALNLVASFTPYEAPRAKACVGLS